MIVLSIIILLSILVWGGIYAEKHTKTNNSFWEGISIWGAVPLVFFTMFYVAGTIGAGYNQISDLESIEYYENTIEIQEEKLIRLTNIIESFDYPQHKQLMNADAPISGTIEEIAKTENEIALRKESLERVKRDLRERERWIFSFVTYIYND